MDIFGLFGVIDVVIVLTVILFAVIGWKKGFLEKVIDMASSVFGLIASILLAKPFSTVLRGWFGEAMESSIHDYLISRSPDFANALSETSLRAALEGLSLPDFMVQWIVDSVDFSQVATSIIDSVTPLVLTLALLFISFVTLFFGSMIIFFLLRILAKGITSVPIIKQVDKFFGLIFGLLKVALLIYILLFVLALVINIPAINNMIWEFLEVDMQLTTEQFRLSKYLYDNNLLKNVINIFVAIA